MLDLINHLLLAQSDSKEKVLVDRDKLQEISRLHNEGFGYDVPWELLLAGIGATLITVAVISARRWWTNRHVDPGPAVLYNAIARKAGLGWRDRYLLWRIAKTFDLPSPIALMLSRGTMRHYVQLYLSNRAGAQQSRAGQRLGQIEDLLFG